MYALFRAQVSKSHLSKVQEQRITEEDLAFDDMEPDCSVIAGFGSKNGSGGRMVSSNCSELRLCHVFSFFVAACDTVTGAC